MADLENKIEPCAAISAIQTAIAVFNYLNEPSVNHSFMVIANRLRADFMLIQKKYNARPGVQKIKLVKGWDAFFWELVENSEYVARNFVNEWIPKMMTSVDSNPYITDNQRLVSIKELESLKDHIGDIEINMDDYEGRRPW